MIDVLQSSLHFQHCKIQLELATRFFEIERQCSKLIDVIIVTMTIKMKAAFSVRTFNSCGGSK